MQSDPRFFTGNDSPCHAYEVGGFTHNTPVGGHYIPVLPAFDAALAGTKHDFTGPLNGLEFQPSETCPKNFIIVDQTDSKGRIMYHPSLAHKFSSSSFNINATNAHEGGRSMDDNDNGDKEKISSSLKEDSEDIDALLSSEEEDEEDEEDEVVSTGRTTRYWGSSSPGSSYSTDGSKSHKMKFTSSQTSFSGSASSSGRDRERMRKMVKALRGILPGGDQMDTPSVIDEAVKYLKSLKVEAEKLGIPDIKDH